MEDIITTTTMTAIGRRQLVCRWKAEDGLWLLRRTRTSTGIARNGDDIKVTKIDFYISTCFCLARSRISEEELKAPKGRFGACTRKFEREREREREGIDMLQSEKAFSVCRVCRVRRPQFIFSSLLRTVLPPKVIPVHGCTVGRKEGRRRGKIEIKATKGLNRSTNRGENDM